MAKESAKKSYQEILCKEKEMFESYEKSEKVLKDKILNYKQIQNKKRKKLINQAEFERKNQIERALNEAIKLESEVKYKQSQIKFNEAEKLERINLSLNSCPQNNKISTQKDFRSKNS